MSEVSEEEFWYEVLTLGSFLIVPAVTKLFGYSQLRKREFSVVI